MRGLNGGTLFIETTHGNKPSVSLDYDGWNRRIERQVNFILVGRTKLEGLKQHDAVHRNLDGKRSKHANMRDMRH